MNKTSTPPSLALRCPKQWESLSPDGGQKRFCQECQLHVHDVSAMSQEEGKRFVAGIEDDRTCISFLVRPNGTMVTRTRWSGLERSWVSLRRVAFTLLAMIAPALFASCAHQSEYNQPMGKTMVSPKDQRAPRMVENDSAIDQAKATAEPSQKPCGIPGRALGPG